MDTPRVEAMDASVCGVGFTIPVTMLFSLSHDTPKIMASFL